MAVQVFLVLGGYLAACSLDRFRQERPLALAQAVWKRYQRLILPLMAALALVTAAAALTRPWLLDDFVPAPPGIWQIALHALMLQDLLGADALSVGVWYVAVDFQLYVLIALIFWGRQFLPKLHFFAEAWVVVLMLVSLLYANRNPELDRWGVYFFGAYGMGAVASWAQRSSRRFGILLGLSLVVVLALTLDFRERLVLAWVAAMLLATMPAASAALRPGLQRLVMRLGSASYGIFLVHFSVLLLTNLLFALGDLHGLLAICAMMALGTLCSIGLGSAFARYVESPISDWLEKRRN